MNTDKNIPLSWISEKLGLSIDRLQFLLKDKLKGNIDALYIDYFDFFEWFFSYRPEIITDEYHAFWIECNDMLYTALKLGGSSSVNLN